MFLKLFDEVLAKSQPKPGCQFNPQLILVNVYQMVRFKSNL